MPVACAKLRGIEKTPAPTMPPTTIAVSVINGSFCSSASLLIADFPVLTTRRLLGADLTARSAVDMETLAVKHPARIDSLGSTRLNGLTHGLGSPAMNDPHTAYSGRGRISGNHPGKERKSP